MKDKIELSQKESKNLKKFFIITLAWTWIVGIIPVILGISNTDYGNMIFIFTAGIAPSCVGIFMAITTYSKEERKKYFKRFIPTSHGFWFVIIYAVLLLIVATISLTTILNEHPDFNTLQNVIKNPSYILLFIFSMYIWGPANEEFGWRGYALDKMLAKYGFIKGTLFLGFIWGIWHLPWIFYADQWQCRSFDISPLWFLIFVVATIFTSFLISIAYILSKRNCFVAASIHAVSNAILGLFYTNISLPGQNLALVSDTLLSTVISFIVLVIFGNHFFKLYNKELEEITSNDIKLQKD